MTNQTYSAQTPQREILTVSQLNRRARQLLETHMPLLWIEGEVSNFARPSSGHWYFTLKDANAQVKCAMFRNRNQRVRTVPQQGQKVLIRARVSLYEGRGDYQVIAEHMEESGVGALQQAFEALKHQLHHEGLFDPAYKKPLPTLPKHIGVVTSPTGAAVRDILQVLRRRFPGIPVSIFPVAVQGAEAAPQIVRALMTANQLTSCDLLIVGRGGGSLEDLWPFNEESVARAIYASRIPVISAVGHEVDITIADYVADLRAPTPSAAAELSTPDGDEMLQQFAGYEVLLEEAMERRLQRHRDQLMALSARLQHPGQKLQAQSQHLDNLEIRLKRVIQNQLQQPQHRLHHLQTRLYSQTPSTQLQSIHERLSLLQQKLQQTMQQKLRDEKQSLAKAAALLDSVNPLSILQRGYSVTSLADGPILKNSDAVKVGDTLITKLADGELTSVVNKVS
ncbi:MAG: exodeoxyribonuclease VII large subunit [Cellvibrionaceae bacterium]|nr:exodeoxyribonuclease VII large subunit [Cellvibrionaceae bacterium]|tara:strand:- start:14070 stop:15422 length:1353 start_codon:yes stop_codon:yes gene_type:complete